MTNIIAVGGSPASISNCTGVVGRKGTGRSDPPNRIASVMLLSIWFGLVTGLIELGFVYARSQFAGWSTLNALQLNRHFPWMIPLTNSVIFLSWGLVVAFLGQFWTQTGVELRVFLLSCPACLSLWLQIPRLYPIAYIVLAIGLALWVACWVSLVPERFGRLVRTSLPVLIIASSLLAGWSGGQIAARRAIDNFGLASTKAKRHEHSVSRLGHCASRPSQPLWVQSLHHPQPKAYRGMRCPV